MLGAAATVDLFLSCQILEALAERFHFTYELVPELLHGKFDGKWTGMVASVRESTISNLVAVMAP